MLAVRRKSHSIIGGAALTSFCEWADTKPKKTPVWFVLDASRPLHAFAGIWTTGRGVRGTKTNPVEGEHKLYCFLTCPGERSGRPRALEGDAGAADHGRGYGIWLRAPWSEAKALQRPYPPTAEVLRRSGCGGKRLDPAMERQLNRLLRVDLDLNVRSRDLGVIGMRKRIATCLVFGVVAMTGCSYALAVEKVSEQDRTFVAKVSQGGMYEVALGKVAEEKGATQDIRDQGNTEAHDHTLVGDKLKSIVAKAGMSFPDKLNSEFETRLDKIKALSGMEFDKAYLEDMKKIHAGDGAAFKKESEDGTDPELRSFALETYRIVQRHIGELDVKVP